jgi:hypothetical protein
MEIFMPSTVASGFAIFSWQPQMLMRKKTQKREYRLDKNVFHINLFN